MPCCDGQAPRLLVLSVFKTKNFESPDKTFFFFFFFKAVIQNFIAFRVKYGLKFTAEAMVSFLQLAPPLPGLSVSIA